MKVKDLGSKKKAELLKLLRGKETEIVRLKMDLATGKIKNVRQLRSKKAEIAQILTAIREKDL
jgi:ribosomal protein L29